MAEHPSPSSDMPLARSVFNKITETVDNFKLHAVTLLSHYEQWNSVQSSFAMFKASMESRAKQLEANEKRVESMLSEIRVREEKLNAEERNLSTEIEERRKELELLETEYEKRLEILEFNEKVVHDGLVVKEKRILELGEALKSKKLRFGEELRSFEVRKREIEEECRCLEAKGKEMREGIEVLESKRTRMMEECRCLEAKGKEMREGIEVLESKKTRMMEECRCLEAKEKEMREGMMMREEFRKLEERERRVEESCRVLKVKEKEIEERSRVEELRGKEMRELGEKMEIRVKEIVEERRVLEKRRKGLEGSEKELDARGKEVELRETNIKECENVLKLKEKELIELERKLELKKKGIDKGFQVCSEELRLKKDQLVESGRALGLKESEIVEKCKQVELRQERINEQWKVLEGKEKEINFRLKAVELKEKEINDKRMILVNEDVDGTKTVEFEEEQIGETSRVRSGRVADLKGVLIKKCTSLFKRADDVIKRQYAEGKLAKDGCNVPRVKELISENPQASSLFAEIQLVFRNDDARATASYLTEQTQMVSMWQENILDLREEITGLLESLIAERKHLQAAMCTCVFKMKDVYSPVFLLNAHLEHVRERVVEIVKKASGTAKDDAANMELSALRNVLRCISDFKLESIYPPTPHELRITQLEKEMVVRTKPTKFVPKIKSIYDLGTELEASKSTLQTKTSPTPNLSAAIPGSHPQMKRKAPSSSSVKQNKHHRYHL